MVPALFSAETAEMSLLHFLFYCRSGGTLDRLVATHGGAQESRLEGGSQQLALRLADRLGDAVRLGSPVSAIRQDDRGVEVTHDGGVVKAGRAIVALPPTLAGRIRYSPALPPLRDQLTQQVPMGYVIKVQIAYPEPFWRAEGLSGSVFSLDDEVSVIFDNSPQDLSCGVLLGFLEGRHGRRAGKLAPEQRKELDPLRVREVLRAPRRGPRRVRRERLGSRGVEPGLLRGALRDRGVDGLRRGAAGARGPNPLGWHGDSGGVERLHGRSDTLRRTRRPRSARLLRTTAPGHAERPSEACSTRTLSLHSPECVEGPPPKSVCTNSRRSDTGTIRSSLTPVGCRGFDAT